MTAAGRYLEDNPAPIIAETASVLARGGAVLFPTDTVYGLLAAPGNPAGYRRIYDLKSRQAGKPLALLVGTDTVAAHAVGGQLAAHPQAAAEFAGGRLTVVLEPAELPPRALPPGLAETQPGTIGLRRPNHAELQELIARCGGWLWATSANASGDPPAATVAELDHVLTRLAGRPDLVVLSRTSLNGTPSRVALLRDGRLEPVER